MSERLFDVRDRVVVVTGGLGQLGRQFTLALALAGAKVAVLDVQMDPPRVAARFGDHASDGRLLFLQADVNQRTSLENALQTIVSRWGVPCALVNNAAQDSPPNSSASENGPFETYPLDSWEQVLRTNVTGVFRCCQVFGGAMAQEGRGSIINVSSIYGLVSPDQRIYEFRRKEDQSFFKPAAYSTSKSALYGLTRYLATYWASRGVRTNTVTFGGVFNQQPREFLQGYCARVPLGRMAREDEYNGAIVFLVSDASSYMTGANLVLDGGWTAW